MKIKKQKIQKEKCHKKCKFEDYENCSEAAQIENKTNQLEKNNIDIDHRDDNKKFIKNNKLILKLKQRFKSEMLDAFADEVFADVFKKEEIKEHNSN